MNEVTERWKAGIQNKINQRTVDWTEAEKAKLDLPYLQHVINTAASRQHQEYELNDLDEKFSRLVTWIPIRSENGDIRYGMYHKELSEFKSYMGKRYQLVSETHYREVFLPIGIALGISFGLLFKNLAVGLALGVVIGFALGTIMKARAEKEGRIID